MGVQEKYLTVPFSIINRKKKFLTRRVRFLSVKHLRVLEVEALE